MRKRFFYLKSVASFILLLVILYSCETSMKNGQKEMMFSKLKDEFKNPSSEYRSAPLWVWNTQVTKADIDRMLLELKDAGLIQGEITPPTVRYCINRENWHLAKNLFSSFFSSKQPENIFCE